MREADAPIERERVDVAVDDAVRKVVLVTVAETLYDGDAAQKTGTAG